MVEGLFGEISRWRGSKVYFDMERTFDGTSISTAAALSDVKGRGVWQGTSSWWRNDVWWGKGFGEEWHLSGEWP